MMNIDMMDKKSLEEELSRIKKENEEEAEKEKLRQQIRLERQKKRKNSVLGKFLGGM